MKFVDDILMKEAFSIRKASFFQENPITPEEKKLAEERIKKDYENSKPLIADYRQEYIRNGLILQKLRKSNNFDNIVDAVDEITIKANSYEDDYIYLMHMIYQNNKDEISLRVRIGNMGQEMLELGNQLNSISRNLESYEKIKDLSCQIAEKKILIDAAVKEAHILELMNSYYQKLSHEIVMGRIKLTHKS